MVYLALSCLQGRPASDALDELASLSGAVQLTPGCAPSDDFVRRLARRRPRFRTHHGYTPHAMRRPVWSADGSLLTDDHSVHPPRLDHPSGDRFWDEIAASGTTVEVMYPGWHLGSSDDLDRAMAMGLPLAVDVSHLWIQRCTVGLRRRTWRRLQQYEHVTEVHLSDNDGIHDLHRPVTSRTFGLRWAVERGSDGAALVLEGRFHQLDRAQQVAQIELCGGGT